MPHNKDTQILTVEEIAKILRKKQRTIREMCYNHQIPYYKVGRTTLFRLELIMEWLEEDCRIDPIPKKPAIYRGGPPSSTAPPALSCSTRAVTVAQGE